MSIRPDPIIGIDLGTTNSLVAIAGWPDATASPRIIPDEQGRALCPSVVRFRPGSTGWEVDAIGHEATARDGMIVVSSVKRLMGRSARDAAGDAPFLPFRVAEGANETARIELPEAGSAMRVLVSPQEVSAHILGHLRRQASRALGVEVSRAVITVPAYFDDAQRQATRDAGRLAGLEVVRIVAEPTAAALAYGLGTRASGASNVVIYDLGGGTFDVSILRISPMERAKDGTGESVGSDAFEVLATSGDTRLGGDDIDHAIVSWLRRELKISSEPDDRMRERLKAAAERAKIELSTREHTTIEVAGCGSVGLSRAGFDELIGPIVERTMQATRRAQRDAKRALDGQAIGSVILVGGSTRVPLVRSRVRDHFGLEPYTAIDPDQAIALGAAVQGAVLMGTNTSALLLDVVPLSLGIETANGAFAKIIMRNSPIPASAHEMFSTQVDGQTAIKLLVLQGEREMVADCRSLGEFHLRGIPPMPAGIPQLRVEFRVDASGVLSVHAAELRSGKRLEVQIVPHHGLTREEVDRLERESFAHAREDMHRHRIADLLANARLDLHWIEKQMAAHGSSLPGPQQEALTGAIQTLRGYVERAGQNDRTINADEFHAAKERLDRASMPLHELAITRSLRS